MSTKKIKLLSFDLDNTLYDNRPVIKRAEDKNKQYLAQEFARQHIAFNFERFIEIRNELMLLKNQSAHSENWELENLTYLRKKVLEQFCQPLKNSAEITEKALQIFLKYRSQVKVPIEILQLLKQLKPHFHLVSVSNGNCDPYQTSMGTYLQKHYAPQHGFRAKPHQQMLQVIKQEFDLTPENILHIGDQVETDGKAAENASCKFFYFSPFEQEQSVSVSCNELIDHLNL